MEIKIHFNYNLNKNR
uniref:Uncharacterized protein n=1 Tax=Lepeophtheirus salmonis TaxID=72036 RepID=A0A0K2UJK5_LEPSM